MDNEVVKFLSAARGDIRTVEQLNSFPVHKQYQSICFHCQQSDCGCVGWRDLMISSKEKFLC